MSSLAGYFEHNLSDEERQILAYVWDDWEYTDYFFEVETPETEVLFQLSGMAIRGLCIAIGEWFVWRFPHAANREIARQYFDAAWSSMLRPRACIYAELPQENWRGPADGALRAIMLITNDTLFDALEDFDFARRGGWAINMARHVVPDATREAFEAWLSAGLARAARHYPGSDKLISKSIFDENFYFGEPVAPELFIPDFNYKLEDALQLLYRHEENMGENAFLIP